MLKQLRGLKSLIHDAVDLTTTMVEEGHDSVARNALRIMHLLLPGSPSVELVEELRRLATSGTLGTVRAVNHLVKELTDAGLSAAEALHLLSRLQEEGPCVPLRSDITGTSAWLRDAALGALNGAVGDYLHREGNGLDLGFSLRLGDSYYPLDRPAPPPLLPAPRLALFIHGLATTEWSWCWDAAAYHGDAGTNFATLLKSDLGLHPIFARYNTGRPVRDNARVLADGLERLFSAQPTPIDELVLIGHSMGGLLSRSACQEASLANHRWVRYVSRVICLGSPHQGAPLEKLGHALTTVLGAVDHPGTRIPAQILRRRSAGIQDLRHGVPLPESPQKEEAIHYHFASSTLTADQSHPLGWLLGDTLVRVASASGPLAQEPAPLAETICFGGILHHQIQNHPEVYAWLRDACRGATRCRSGAL